MRAIPKSRSGTDPTLLGTAALVFGATALCAGCRIYDPELSREAARRDAAIDAHVDDDAGARDAGVDARVPDAGMDAGPPDTGVDGGGGCVPHRAPAVGGGDPGGDMELLFALRDAVLDQRGGRWELVAYDLDGLCTSDADPRGACMPAGSARAPLDGHDGIDNAAGRDILTLAATYDPTFEASARMEQMSGRGTMLVHVRGWNGTGDDPRVDAYVAQGTRMTDAAGTGPPAWDGSDRFYAATADFAGGNPTMPLIRDDVAYVAGSTLFMRVPEGRSVIFPWSGNTARLVLTGGSLTGRISADGTRLEEVRITGRWATVDIAEVLTAVGLCPGSVERSFADTAIMNAADVRADPRTDGSGAACDALSLGIGFTGFATTLGGVEVAPDEPPMCP